MRLRRPAPEPIEPSYADVVALAEASLDLGRRAGKRFARDVHRRAHRGEPWYQAMRGAMRAAEGRRGRARRLGRFVDGLVTWAPRP